MISLTLYNERDGQSRSCAFTQKKVTLGRAKSNDVVLVDGNVSRLHACIEQTEKGVFFLDQKSANGSFLSGKRLPAAVAVPWQQGDAIVIGSFRICLEQDAHGEVCREEPSLLRQTVAPSVTSSYLPSMRRNVVDPQLKADIHEKLLSEIDLRRLDINEIGEETFRLRCDQIVRRILRQIPEEAVQHIHLEELIKDILDEALGLGPLEDLLADNSVSEIMVNSKDMIFVERKGVIELSRKSFSSDASVAGIIQRIVGPIGRRIDESSPLVDARLKDGSRVNAVIPPLALNGPCITIRKFSKKPLSAKNLLGWGSLSESMLQFVKVAVQQKQNIVISGGTGSGKTTLLNIFSSFIPHEERVVTIEDAAELQLNLEHIVRLESRPANIEGKGAVTIQDLVKNALRMRPDRIIVGECRGAEALDMLQAMNTGHDGSMTTGHANTPHDMLVRLETMVMMAGKDIPSQAIREQIVSAVNIIIQQTRFACGTRKVTRITEVTEMIDGQINLQDIFCFKQNGHDENGKVKGRFIATGRIPDCYLELQRNGIAVDMSIFQNDGGEYHEEK